GRGVQGARERDQPVGGDVLAAPLDLREVADRDAGDAGDLRQRPLVGLAPPAEYRPEGRPHVLWCFTVSECHMPQVESYRSRGRRATGAGDAWWGRGSGTGGGREARVIRLRPGGAGR